MKNFKLIWVLCLIGLFGCDADVVEYGSTKTPLGISSPYLQIVTPSISFQAGTPSYTVEFNAINTDNIFALTSINSYKTFTNASDGSVSDRLAFQTYDLGGDTKTVYSQDVTYDDLKEGLSLPDDQNTLAVGSGWLIDFEGTQADGTVLPLSGVVRISIQSRFAGLYEVVESKYVRIGVDNGGWNGEERFISSVDANTFKYNDYWGTFGFSGGGFLFDIDEATNTFVNFRVTEAGLFSGNRMVTCENEPETFEIVTCDGSNNIVPNDETGAHVITLTYGYFTDGSGPRSFFEKMEKLP
jgi:hypothetical protein